MRSPFNTLFRAPGHPLGLINSNDAGSAPVSPADYDFDIWLDASTDDYVSTAAGGGIDGATNRGTLGGTMAQAVGGKQPTYGSINGVRTFAFDGTQVLRAGSETDFAVLGDATFIIPFALDALSGEATLLSRLNGGYVAPRVYPDGDIDVSIIGPGKKSFVADTPLDSVPHILIIRLSATSLDLWIRGASTNYTGSAAGDLRIQGAGDRFLFGAFFDSGARGWVGQTNDVLIKSAAMTEADMNTLCSQNLAPKYGITWSSL